jgi:hypothetical protein
VALLDLEFGHIGDPLADLAGLWVRNPFIPLGDVAALMRRYQDGSGALVDIVAVRWLYILWALSNQLEFHAALADPVPGSDYMLNLHWCIETNLMALERSPPAPEWSSRRSKSRSRPFPPTVPSACTWNARRKDCPPAIRWHGTSCANQCAWLGTSGESARSAIRWWQPIWPTSRS